MPVVVADTSPINYLVQIDAVELLPKVFESITISAAVHAELAHQRTPAVVSDSCTAGPRWRSGRLFGWLSMRRPRARRHLFAARQCSDQPVLIFHAVEKRLHQDAFIFAVGAHIIDIASEPRMTVGRYPSVAQIAPVGPAGSYLRNAGIPTYGHSGLAGDVDDVRAHGKDERVLVKSFFDGVEYQYRLVRTLSGGK